MLDNFDDYHFSRGDPVILGFKGSGDRGVRGRLRIFELRNSGNFGFLHRAGMGINTITKYLPALLKISKKKQRFISDLVKIY